MACESLGYNNYHSSNPVRGKEGASTYSDDGSLYIGKIKCCADGDVSQYDCRNFANQDWGGTYTTHSGCGHGSKLMITNSCTKTEWDPQYKRKCCLGEITDSFQCDSRWTPFSPECKEYTANEVCHERNLSTGRLAIENDMCEDVYLEGDSGPVKYGIGCKTWCDAYPDECRKVLQRNCYGKSLERNVCLEYASEPDTNLDIPYKDFCSGLMDIYEHPENTIFYFKPTGELKEFPSIPWSLPPGDYVIETQWSDGSFKGLKTEEFLTYHDGISKPFHYSGTTLSQDAVYCDLNDQFQVVLKSEPTSTVDIRVLGETANGFRCVIHFYPATLTKTYGYTLSNSYQLTEGPFPTLERLTPEVSIGKDYCHCFRPDAFYKKYFDDVNSRLTEGTIPYYQDCYYPPCALSSFSTSGKKTGLKKCPNISQCIQIADINIDGSLSGDISISQTQECGHLSKEKEKQCPEGEFLIGEQCAKCPEGTKLSGGICEPSWNWGTGIWFLTGIVFLIVILVLIINGKL